MQHPEYRTGRSPGTHEHRPLTEDRLCPSCEGGGWTVDARDYDPETGTLVVAEVLCPRCGGAGVVAVFVYPKPSTRTRRAPCVSCGSREPVKHLVEVGADNPSLCLYEGDRVCVPCGRRLGVA